MARSDHATYWRATSWLAAAVLIVWLALGPGLAVLAAEFAADSARAVRIGYLLIALVSPLGLVALAFWFADRQDRLDRDHGMAGED